MRETGRGTAFDGQRQYTTHLAMYLDSKVIRVLDDIPSFSSYLLPKYLRYGAEILELGEELIIWGA